MASIDLVMASFAVSLAIDGSGSRPLDLGKLSGGMVCKYSQNFLLGEDSQS